MVWLEDCNCRVESFGGGGGGGRRRRVQQGFVILANASPYTPKVAFSNAGFVKIARDLKPEQGNACRRVVFDHRGRGRQTWDYHPEVLNSQIHSAARWRNGLGVGTSFLDTPCLGV